MIRRVAPQGVLRVPWIEFLVVAALVAVAVRVFSAAPPDLSTVEGLIPQNSDAAMYLGQLAHPGWVPPTPFAYRVLTPTLVRLLPWSPEMGFAIVTVVALAAAAVVVAQAIRRFTDDLWRARAGAAVFLLTGGAFACIRNAYITDPVGLLVIGVTFLLLWQKRFGWLALVLAVGVLNRETTVFLALPVLLVLVRHDRPVTLRKASAVAVPVLGYLVVVATPFLRGTVLPSSSPLSQVSVVLGWRRANDGSLAAALLFAAAISFGPFWYLGLRALRELPVIVRTSAFYLVVPWLSLLLASDWQRMLGVAFPLLIVPAFARARAAPLGAASAVMAFVALISDFEVVIVAGLVGTAVTVWVDRVSAPRGPVPTDAPQGPRHAAG